MSTIDLSAVLAEQADVAVAIFTDADALVEAKRAELKAARESRTEALSYLRSLSSAYGALTPASVATIVAENERDDSTSATVDVSQTQHIRVWARSLGLNVPDKGAVPKPIMQLFQIAKAQEIAAAAATDETDAIRALAQNPKG